jgi:hypothetical protein
VRADSKKNMALSHQMELVIQAQSELFLRLLEGLLLQKNIKCRDLESSLTAYIQRHHISTLVANTG